MFDLENIVSRFISDCCVGCEKALSCTLNPGVALFVDSGNSKRNLLISNDKYCSSIGFLSNCKTFSYCHIRLSFHRHFQFCNNLQMILKILADMELG